MLSESHVSEMFGIFKPPERLLVSEWADTRRQLPREAASESGNWRTSRAEFQRGIMDATLLPEVEIIVVVKPGQIGWTEIICNIAGRFIELDPGPMLVIQPTLDMAHTWSKDRFSTMVRDTPVLRKLVNDVKTRDSSNTITRKSFPGGILTVAGANSPVSLASRPIRFLLIDEVDRFPASAGVEGDPVSLALKRTNNFWNRLILMGSTPTIKGFSRIEEAFLESNQQYFYIPCFKCDTVQRLHWGNVKWPKGKPAAAEYECSTCAAMWNDSKRWSAIRYGKWIADKPDIKNIAGFHISEIYSPWRKLRSMAEDFIKAKGNPERLKTFVNLSLAETWEDEGEKFEADDLYNRRERYAAKVPADVLLLTCAVDVQKDHLVGEVIGWGLEEESWGIETFKIYGDLTSKTPWDDLDNYLKKTFPHENGYNLVISCTCIDSGGHNTQDVYRFVKKREHRRIFAIKGSGVAGMPIIGRSSKKNKGKVRLFTVGTDAAKERIFQRIKILDPGPGYMHFPAAYDEEFFKQLAAEKAEIKYRHGFPYRRWVKTRARNEALDVRVYNLAALEILNPNFPAIKKNIESRLAEMEKEEKAAAPQKAPRKSWAKSWKR